MQAVCRRRCLISSLVCCMHSTGLMMGEKRNGEACKSTTEAPLAICLTDLPNSPVSPPIEYEAEETRRPRFRTRKHGALPPNEVFRAADPSAERTQTNTRTSLDHLGLHKISHLKITLQLGKARYMSWSMHMHASWLVQGQQKKEGKKTRRWLA